MKNRIEKLVSAKAFKPVVVIVYIILSALLPLVLIDLGFFRFCRHLLESQQYPL